MLDFCGKNVCTLPLALLATAHLGALSVVTGHTCWTASLQSGEI